MFKIRESSFRLTVSGKFKIYKSLKIYETVCFLLLEACADRKQLGLPAVWTTVCGWLMAVRVREPIDIIMKSPKDRKFPNVPILNEYFTNPGDYFWSLFPKKSLPKKVTTPIRVNRLKVLIRRNGKNWNKQQRWVAKRALHNIEKGAITHTKISLPAIRCKNAESALIFGTSVTDTIADWISSGYVSGPFDHPPLCEFRSNALMAVVQPSKIRPVMNLSSPKLLSLNDAVNELLLPKLSMSTAKEFSYSLLDAGLFAKMWKFDLKDAYKNIGTHPCMWKLHGFQWLQKFFVDTTTIFGSKSAPADFDCVAEMIANLALARCKFPAKFFHRTLDDTVFVIPNASKEGEKLAFHYQKICKILNVGLAPFDECKEKSFQNSTNGTVLGIMFDSEKMCWSYPKGKNEEFQNMIYFLQNTPGTHLLFVQKIIGKWESIVQMFPFAKGFKWPMLRFLKDFNGNEEVVLAVPIAVKEDLNIWSAIATAAVLGFPICPRPHDPPIGTMDFISDAAGKPPNCSQKNGVASLGVNKNKIWFGFRIYWPKLFTLVVQNNTAVYEMVGLLLPFFVIPRKLQYRHVKLLVDNQSIVWAWEKKYMKNDVLASILIRCLMVLEAYVPCKVFIEHVPRMSNPFAKVVDSLTRDVSTTEDMMKYLTHSSSKIPVCFQNWLEKPTADWSLSTQLINEIQV